MLRSLAPVAIAILGAVSPTFAQADETAEIPDFSGGWVRIGDLVEMFEAIPDYYGPGPMLVDPEFPHEDGGFGIELRWVSDLENPILQPATLERMQFVTENEIRGVPHVKDEGVCRPSGVPMIWNRRDGVQILQTPTEIAMLSPRDRQVRKVYLGQSHSDRAHNRWYGDSIGHYEGNDTLVIDTVGQNDRTQIDRFGTPHSNQVHVVERLTLSPDRQSMEIQFTVEDPVAFTAPWSGRVGFRYREIAWDEQVCAENNRHIGVVTLDGAVIDGAVPTPTELTPDF
jgi:hypothetical protein